MSGTPSKQYTVQDQQDLHAFVSRAIDGVAAGGNVFDSASAASGALDAVKNTPGVALPAHLDELMGRVEEGQEGKLMQSVFDGVRTYEREHGFRPSGDVLLSAIAQGLGVYDSVDNGHHDQISINPNAPIVAVLGAMAEACPFAGYLPADKGSNEARLIIVSHEAGSNFGAYTMGDLMDGIAQGDEYIASARTLELTAPNDATAYKFGFTTQLNGGNPLKLLRGRAIVYVNGLIAAQETQNGPSNAAQVAINGHIKIDGVEYSLAGTVKPLTGEVSITPTPAFPAGTSVTCEAFVDYEADASVTPEMRVQAVLFSLFASPYRALFRITPEARSQFANEVGIDAASEAMLTVRGQFATERHYNALRKAKMLGKYQNHSTFDFGIDEQIQQKVRWQIWLDFASVLGAASQKMAEDTADHGITHLYVTREVLAQFRSMPRELFEPSGIVDRPGIYRAGRLFGLYEVYYTPKGLNQAADGSTAEILCVGRSTQTARCPIIFGDASAPVFDPLGVQTDLKSGYGFHARVFTAQNPHEMSAKGAALISVINLK